MHVGRGRSPGRADRLSAGPVVSNSEPLSPRRTPGLACGGAAQLYRFVKVAKYHKYSSDTQINVVKVSLPHTLFWLLRFVKLKPCIRPVSVNNAPVYETSQLVYETSDTKRLVYETSGIPTTQVWPRTGILHSTQELVKYPLSKLNGIIITKVKTDHDMTM